MKSIGISALIAGIGLSLEFLIDFAITLYHTFTNFNPNAIPWIFYYLLFLSLPVFLFLFYFKYGKSNF